MHGESRVRARFAGAAFTVAMALLILLLAVEHTAYDERYYRSFQRNNRIVEATGRTQAELDRISKDTITYLQTGEKHLMTDHYGQRETAHMADVFGLFRLARMFKLISMVLIVGILSWAFIGHFFDRMVGAMNYTLVVGLLAFAALAYFASRHWDQAFTMFHRIFFNNDLWLLNPATDLMIQMMPAPFFVGMAVRIAVKFSLGMILAAVLCNLIAVTIRLRKAHKHRAGKE